MQTSFTLAQLADPAMAESEKILRACVHCGFCTATCPTYVLLGDELDSPRGRIYLIKDMLENDKPASQCAGRQAHRPLPVVPVLHDHLSVRRPLHASGRPRAKAHRGRPTTRPDGRTLACAVCLPRCCRDPRCVPPRRCSVPSWRARSPGFCSEGARGQLVPRSRAMLALGAFASTPSPSHDRPCLRCLRG